MEDFKRKIRICEIDYTNVWPVTHYFPVERFRQAAEIIRSVPSELNRGMREGTIDMGPISSFAYGANFEQYLLLPELSVSALGPVRSIILFYRESLEQAANGRIALTTTSETSVNLLKIIMEKFRGAKPSYHFAAPSLHDMMGEHDAALLIGDDAIRSSWEDNGYRTLDLGAEWTKLTGHSMTFAVWAVRRELAQLHPELISDIHHAFLASKRKAAQDPDGIYSAAMNRMGGTYDYWQQYFAGLSHDFSLQQQAGLKLYYDYAANMGLLDRPAPLHFFNSKT